MEQVKWKTNFYSKVDAQKCFEEMGDKDITPQKIVDIARNENTELHKCFEWDDSIASEKYRLIQARNVIVNLVVVPKKKEEIPRRVLQISSQRNTYQPQIFFMKNEDEYQILLQRATRELKSFKDRYSSISEFEVIFDEIDKL